MRRHDREHQIGEFFAANADRLRATVARNAHGLPDQTIEDACQTAWTTLLRRDDIILDRRGFSWLATIAIREAWAASRHARTEQPSNFAGTSPANDHSRLTEPAASPDVADEVTERLEHEQRIEDLGNIKPQDRRALWLQAMGYSYKEIQDITGATYTAVNRRLTEGRRDLRDIARGRDEDPDAA